MSTDRYDEGTERLFKAILSLETEEEAKLFFSDLFTPEELQVFAKRLCAAEMILDGKIYSEINEKTGLSTATISRVNRELKYGDGGYRLVLDRIEKTDKDAK